MASVSTIRQRLYQSLDAALGDTYQVSPYVLSAPAARTIWLSPSSIDYHAAMDNGAQWWTFHVTAFVALISDRAAQEKADAFFDEDPVRVALESDPTLSGACDDLIVVSGAYRSWEHPSLQQPVIGGEWEVRILA